MENYERVFKRFDRNGDGKICPAELRRCVGFVMTEEEAATALAALVGSDGDSGQLLGLEDFVRIVEGAGEEEKARDMKKAFRMYEEIECSGCITPNSLRRMLSILGEPSWSVDQCSSMIAQFDLDGDGVLSFHEFQAMMMS